MRKSPTRLTAPLRRISARLGLVLASLVATGVLLELGVRSFSPHVREHALPRELVPADDLLGWRLAPSQVVRHRSQYFDTDYATNALGYRDKPRSPSTPASYRLLLFGDSQIFGWGLRAEQRFSNLVEGGSDRLELWNLGVPGYGIDQQVLSYERDAAAWPADGVIFFVSKFTEDRLHKDYVSGYYKPIFRLTVGQDLEMRSPRGRMPRSLLFASPRWMYTPYLVDRLLARTDHRLRPGRVAGQEGSSELLAAVLGLGARLAVERRQTLFVLSTRPPEDEGSLRRLCADLGVRYLTIGLPVERAGLVFGPYDAHWNADANQRISASLGPQLAAISGELPVSSRPAGGAPASRRSADG